MSLKRRQRVEPEFSLAAMIDVIFLLLMFFMLTSKFVTPNALNLSLPSSTATTMASPNFAVSIDKGGSFYLDRTKTPENNLENAIAARMKAMNKEAKDITITVVAEKGVPIENVVYVLDIANRLKVKTILATDPKAEPSTK